MGRTTISLERDGPLAVITLNRPDAMNAFTLVMGEELRAAFDETDADTAVRAVIVTGAGKAFCAGADLSTGAETFNAVSQANASGTLDDRDPQWRDSGGMLNLRIFDSQKPVVAAINGASVGIGATMILPMDARIGLKGYQIRLPVHQARHRPGWLRQLVPAAHCGRGDGAGLGPVGPDLSGRRSP